MNGEQQKAKQFVGRLLSNPAVKHHNPLQQELEIVQFLKTNRQRLLPTLSSASFFPNKNWVEIFTLLSRALRNVVDDELFHQLEKIVDEIDFAFVSFLRQQSPPLSEVKQDLFSFQKQILKKDEVRRAYIGPVTASQHHLIDRYVEEAFRRRQYIHFELVKVQKLRMSQEEIKNLLQVTLLLKGAVYVLGDSGAFSFDGASPHLVTSEFMARALQVLKSQLTSLPPSLIRGALNSNVSFVDDPTTETTARLVSIFTLRSQEYQPITKLDRGADSPDKSWFSVARRNFKFYGLDVKMLDELYKIAGENGW